MTLYDHDAKRWLVTLLVIFMLLIAAAALQVF